jgi:hypothetical protein
MTSIGRRALVTADLRVAGIAAMSGTVTVNFALE